MGRSVAAWPLLWIMVVGCGDDDVPPAGMDAGAHDGGGGDGGGGPCSTPADCDDGMFCNGEETCSAGRCEAGTAPSCDDGNDCTLDACNEEGGMCAHLARDADADGHGDGACGGDDCDDADAVRFPGAMEVCDADDRDEDCDPATFGFRDVDMDLFPDAQCCNGDTCGSDCNDSLPGVHPTATETCNTLDDDCDGMVDDGVLMTFHADADMDGHGTMDPTMTTTGCMLAAGWSLTADDCDDGNSARNPGLGESCEDAIDNDCDGVPNDGCTCMSGMMRDCDEPGVCRAGRETCVAGSWGDCPVTGSAEICDGEDDDCDGTVDEGTTVTCYGDADDDGFAPAGAASGPGCPVAPSGDRCGMGLTSLAPAAGTTDCNDANRDIRPMAAEICNAIDDDCDGMTDEGVTVTVYRDVDGDGHGNPSVSRAGCAGDAGYAVVGDDCQDGNAMVHPGVTTYPREPYCRSGTRCYDEPTMQYRCTVGMFGRCDTATTAAISWDYNCNGTEELEPPGTAMCSGLCGFPSTCAGGGMPFGATTCGAAGTRYTCSCFGGCTRLTGTSTRGCR